MAPKIALVIGTRPEATKRAASSLPWVLRRQAQGWAREKIAGILDRGLGHDG